MTDETSQPAGGEATPTIEDRLASFDFDAQPAAPQQREAEHQEAGTDTEPTDEAAADVSGAQQPDDDDPEFNLRDGQKVKLSALKKSYRPDYEREYSEFENKRKAFEAQAQQVGQRFQTLTQHEQQVSQALTTAITVLQHRMPKAPDESLLETDPFAFQQQKHAHEKALADLQQLTQNQHQLMRTAQQRQQQQFAEHIKKQHEQLITAMPDLKDPAKAAKFWEQAKSYGASVGFTPQEMSQVQDARVLMVLRDAQQWRAHQERQAKLKEKAKEAAPMPPPTTAPARRQSSAERERASMRDQLTRLRKTGSAKDGEAFLSQFD